MEDRIKAAGGVSPALVGIALVTLCARSADAAPASCWLLLAATSYVSHETPLDRTKAQVSAAMCTSQVDAYRSVLTDKSADGAFVSAAISLPTASELVDDITDADPLLLHEVHAQDLTAMCCCTCSWQSGTVVG